MGNVTDARDPSSSNVAAPTLYKLLLGTSGVNMATWSGPRFPNKSSAAVSYGKIVQNCSQGCLYEVLGDPTEHHEISAAHPEIVAALRQRLEAAEAVAWIPERGAPMKEACDRTRYAMHYGPWLELGEL
jgi:arylsulfatase I/J